MDKNIFKFNVKEEYDSKNNYEMAILCDLVYGDESDIAYQVETWKKSDSTLKYIVKTIEQSSDTIAVEELGSFFENTSRFMVIYNNDFIILVFRGSNNITDWIKDIEKDQVDFKEGKGKVHKGFYNTVKNMQTEINEVIDSIRKNEQKIYITGHSLGGAQAILAPFVCASLKDFTMITTFGQPRVGNKEFATWINEQINTDIFKNSKYFRMVNKTDPVANLPYFSYYHCGNFYIHCYKEKYYNIENLEETTATSVESALLSTSKLTIPIISNHFIDLYVENASRNYDFNPFK